MHPLGGSAPHASYRMRLATCPVLFASLRIPRWVYLDSNTPRILVPIDPSPSQLSARPHPADNSFHYVQLWGSRVAVYTCMEDLLVPIDALLLDYVNVSPT
jgi:hypothetical protein